MIRAYDGVEPTIADSAYVDPEATVIGAVTIEAEASVWPGAVLRGDNGRIVVGERANVQDNATLHEDAELGPGVTVGHNAIVHAASVRERALVGMGAIVLDDADVKQRAIVGANSLVTEGTTVPESTLAVGQPAEPIREVEGSAFETTADKYANLGAEYGETSEVVAEKHVPED